ncbi:FAD/NAD(P)-binding protein [Streptomyces sp. NPDC056670]|uniref:FAD/NAD(P)-binding protein n=1 Tax=Streptomyces sp. NPDC056670 TaxID=3345904 RepID=UPI0036D02086
MPPRPLEICIVGAGPRGLSVLERLCANERAAPAHSAVTVRLVDPYPAGAGSVWRTDQSPDLLMNTVASQITLYTDLSCRIDGPVEPGPTLYEWARTVAEAGRGGDHDQRTLDAVSGLGPDSYPTRALYGQYLKAAYRRVVARAPEHVTVETHRSRAVALFDSRGSAAGSQSVRLEDGSRIDGLDVVVLAQGHVPTRPTPREELTGLLARGHRLAYFTPANPADLDLSSIEPGENVLLRGLGLNFFDLMALLTAGRGGSFVRTGDRLVYRPSGREPRLYASSRRGIPHHARGENEKGAFGRYIPRLLTAEHIDKIRQSADGRRQFGFITDLWPLIAREVESVYYGTLLSSRGRDAEREEFVACYLADASELLPGLLDRYGIAGADRWNWQRLAHPYLGVEFADRDAFRRWLLDHLAEDVRQARAGNLSNPLKAALDVLRDLRNEIRLAVDHGGLNGDSHQVELDAWYTPLNAFLSIGPPILRIEEMAALIEAGVLELTGPDTCVRIDAEQSAFVATSSLIPGAPVSARVLIEARLPEPDLRRTADPLLLHLLTTGQATPHRIASEAGRSYETGGLAVTERPYRLLDAQQAAHPRRFAYGVPTEGVHWVTAAGTRPGVDSMTLADADSIARAVLATTPGHQVRDPERSATARLAEVIV